MRLLKNVMISLAALSSLVILLVFLGVDRIKCIGHCDNSGEFIVQPR